MYVIAVRNTYDLYVHIHPLRSTFLLDLTGQDYGLWLGESFVLDR